ncbi:MAG: lysoplasmalogenase [Roseiflexus sp.]
MQRHIKFAYALLALAALVVLVGLAAGNRHDRRNRLPLPLRMLSSFLVWLAALLLWRGAMPVSHRPAKLAAAGMGCGFLGDLIMARVIPLPHHVIFGMLAFGVGHGCYIGATAHHLAQRDALRRLPLPLLASWIVGAAGWHGVAHNPAQPDVLNRAALAYALLLASMVGMSAALAARDQQYLSLAIGGALFFFSDLILAGELFRDLFFPGIGDVIWLTYLTGQGLIVATLGTVQEAQALPSTDAERE